MLKKLKYLSCLLILLVSNDVFAQFEGGSGTEDDPYLISTVEQLQEIKNHLDYHFLLLNDMDAGSSNNWNNGKGFDPIGNDTLAFTGSFDGGKFTISNLTINREAEYYVGLFGYTEGATIQNIHITDASVSGSNNTGLLIGFRNGGQVIEAQVSGSVSGRTLVGGLIGFNYGNITTSSANGEVTGNSHVGGMAGFNRGKISESYSISAVSGTGNSVGGLVGNNYDGSISNSYAHANVTGSNSSAFGGLVGSNGGEIKESYAHGETTGRSYVGGLVGFNRGKITDSYAEGITSGKRNGVGGLTGNNYGGEITRTYALGEVRGATQIGGLAGINKKHGKINESYAANVVTGNEKVGGFIGINDHPLLYNYWNSENSNQQRGVGSGLSEGVTGLGKEEMTGKAGEKNMKNFSFGNYWGSVPGGFPQLLWLIPYSQIEHVETNAPVISGEVLTFEVLLKNIGGLTDTNSVTVKDRKGMIIEFVDNVVLKNEEELRLSFEWQSTEEDKGEYDFTIETSQVKKAVTARVRNIPFLVELLKPEDVDVQVNVEPEFSWEAAKFADQYHLQIAEDEKFKSLVVDVDNIGKLSYQLSNPLKHYTDYLWRVRGRNPDETGEWSEVMSFTTIMEKPEIVTLYEPGNEMEATSVAPTLSWSASERAERYILQLAKDDDFKELVFDTTFSASDTTFRFGKDLEAETEFFWRVQAYNDGGSADWSELLYFLTIEGPAKSSDSMPIEFTLEQNYPNPFNPVTYIRYGVSSGTRVHIEVLNLSGQSVATLVDQYKSAGWHTATFDASELSSGFYIYRMKAGDFIDTKKLMVIK